MPKTTILGTGFPSGEPLQAIKCNNIVGALPLARPNKKPSKQEGTKMFYIIYSFILGSVIGSFLNVVIYRLPRGENLSRPGSHCPVCNEAIKWYDNVPIFSYIALRGKCRVCKTKISIQYPLIEILTGILFLLVYLKFGYTLNTIKFFIFVSILLSAAIIDIKSYFLPDSLTFSLIILGIISATVSHMNYEISFMGAAAYAFPFLLLYGYGEYIFKKEAMGFGDIKLAAGIGSFLGYAGFFNLYLYITITFVIGSVVSLTLIRLKIKERTSQIAFAPYLALAGFIMMFIQG